ncbi:MAG: short chain dehydrogenase, partial [Candidatus Eisenbacteria bacterium]|nr:short chain dehydrogenase [Candidatus Eisenbacteria bacterium]
VVEELEPRHEVLRASRSSGDIKIDITDKSSIEAAYKEAGNLDAVISTAGKVKFAPFEELDEEGYEIGLRDKLMGQVNLVLIGRKHLGENGSFTLSTGVLDQDPIRSGSSASMVNGAINAFVTAAAIEMPMRQRINAVSSGVIEEAMEAYGPFFRGFEPVPAARAALAYAKSVEGLRTGQVFRVL